MTTQPHPPTPDAPPPSPTQEATRWLSAFGAALERRDIPAATELFEPGGYWRDLLSFTWNIKTLEGRDQIAEMLRAQLGAAGPSNWQLEGEVSEAGGVTEAWLSFDTAVSRGRGTCASETGRPGRS